LADRSLLKVTNVDLSWLRRIVTWTRHLPLLWRATLLSRSTSFASALTADVGVCTRIWTRHQFAFILNYLVN